MNRKELLRELKEMNLQQRALQVHLKRYNSHHLDLSRAYQDVIELHATGDKNGRGYTHFQSFYQTLLPKQKHERFAELIGKKLPTVEVVENIFSDLKKVFSAQNREIYYGLTTEEEKIEADRLNINYFMENTLWEHMKYAPNDILLVKVDDNGDPTYEFIDLQNVCAISNCPQGMVDFLLYKVKTYEKEIYYVYIDWEGVVMFSEKTTEKDGSQIVMGELYEHGFSYCPAIIVFPKISSPKSNPTLSDSPLLKSIHRLDWLAFWIPAKKYFDSYASFPIIAKFEERQSYDTEMGDREMSDGIYNAPNLDTSSPLGSVPSGNVRAGKNANIIGPGTVLEVPVPDNDTLPNILEAIKFISVDNKALDWVDKQEDILTKRLYYSVVGKGADFIEKFSASSEQLENAYDSRKNVLGELRTVMERVHKFYADTVFSIKFGNNYDSEATNIFYGDTYYLMTPQQVVKQYDSFVRSGMPESFKLNQLKTLIYTTYAGSPNELFRAEVLLNCEPLPTTPSGEFIIMARAKAIDNFNIYKKLYFNDVVEEFELTFGDIGAMSSKGMKFVISMINNFFESKYSDVANQLQYDFSNLNIRTNREITKSIPNPTNPIED
jgi:hypothetical protein